MTINPDLQGRSYPAAEVYDVGREKIREFARAVKATHPAHFDVEAARALGHTDLVAPPTFAIIIAQRADAQLIEDPDAGIDFTRVVHADQRFIHHRPIFAGDRLVAELHVDGVRAMGGGAMITTRQEIFALTDGGTDSREAVATATSSILVRGEGQ
jgi:acyl dehydratase